MRTATTLPVTALAALAVGSCAPGTVGGRADSGAAGPADSAPQRDLSPRPRDAGAEASADAPPADDGAYLHANLWSVWWNDRTRCGAERTFLEICQRRGEADCGRYRQAVDACDPLQIVPGQVGPEKQQQELCRRGAFPDIGGCDAREYDFARLRFWWYGAEWQGNWPVATIKIFRAGADWTGGGELIALSNVPGAQQAAMSGIANHGLGFGCAMPGVTSGDEKYRKPFGGFAWIAVPTDQPVTVVAAAACNFADRAFAGCARGAASQEPWITAAPGAVLGCVYVQENVTFARGRHYRWAYGKIEPLPAAGPPQELIDGFALPAVGVDIRTREACKL